MAKVDQVKPMLSPMLSAVLGVTRYVILLLLCYLSNITKYAIKTGNITQVTLLTNIMHYLSNIVTVTSLILRNITRQMQTASWGEPDDFEVLMAVQTTIDLTSCMNSSYCSWILPVSVQA